MILEENEYAKIKLKAENANKQLQEKQAIRNTIEEKISKIEDLKSNLPEISKLLEKEYKSSLPSIEEIEQSIKDIEK